MIPGTKHFPAERDIAFSRMAIGIAWPGLRPGFVVVVGEHRVEQVAGKPKLEVLDEDTDERLYHVVEKAAALWFYYRTEIVVADAEHVAAMQFVQAYRDRGFHVEHSLLNAMDGALGYAVPVLARIHEQGRLVLPAGARMRGEIKTITPHEDLGRLRLADYPGIAALAFAVLELDRTREMGRGPRQEQADTGGKVLG